MKLCCSTALNSVAALVGLAVVGSSRWTSLVPMTTGTWVQSLAMLFSIAANPPAWQFAQAVVGEDNDSGVVESRA